MLSKIENSWKLAKECWRVLMLDKEMLMFPFFSTLTTVAIFATLATPLWFIEDYSNNGLFSINGSNLLDKFIIAKILLLAVIPSYLTYVILTFFNSGLITCAFIRLCGDDPVLSDGLRMAWKRMPQILVWSVLAATVGLFFRTVKSNSGMLGSLTGGLLDFGWKIASFFAIPVIIAEEKSAVDAFKRSTELIKKNWGEAITLEIGFSALATPAMIPGFFIIGLAIFVSTALPTLAIILMAIGVAYALLVSFVISALGAIAKAALYMYASGNQIPENFNKEILESIIKRKNAETPVLA